MFLKCLKSTPVLPPILESTCDTKVVGICTKSIPLRYVAAANPQISPTTPPPRASKISFLSNLLKIKVSYIPETVSRCLFCSPASNICVNTFSPSSSSFTLSRYISATFESVTIQIFLFSISNLLNSFFKSEKSS